MPNIPDNQLEDILAALDNLEEAVDLARCAVNEQWDIFPRERDLCLDLDMDEIAKATQALDDARPA